MMDKVILMTPGLEVRERGVRAEGGGGGVQRALERKCGIVSLLPQ